jgi:uncharacterized protein (DUF58 family)
VITHRGLGLFAAAGLVTLLAAAAGAVAAVVAFVAANALAAGIVLADWLAADPGAIALDREPPPPLSIGRRNPVPVRIRNDGGAARTVTVADAAPAGVALEPVRRDVRLEAGEERVLKTVAVPRRRGPVRFGALEVRVLGPLGVAFRDRSHPGTAVAAVAWPDVIQLREAALLPPGRRPHGERLVRGEAAAREFESLREYVRGDEYRRIAWKATARRGKPVVVMHQPERGQTLLLAIEAGRLMHGAGGDGLGKIDRAVNAAVMLAAVAREYDDAVGLVAFSHRRLATLPPSARPGQLRRVVDTVAPLEPELVEPDWRACLTGLVRMSRRRAVVVVFSDALYAQTDDRLAALLGTLARRHAVVFASIRDAELTELAAQPVTGAGALYERGVATKVIADRDAALAGIRRRGVHTVDSSPARLTEVVTEHFRALRAAS